MSGAETALALSVFLACAVEAVEALTIVLAVGSTRSWSSAMSGVGAATVALAAIVAAFGPALTSLPIDLLRVLVGGLLLIFGLQWLRKAVLRAGGIKAKHDELGIFVQQRQAARAAAKRPGFDGYAFTIAFKGVLLEGLEVAFIVLTFGANQHRVALAAAAAGLAVLLVAAAGAAARAPLARVPENTMKLRRRRDAQLIRDVLGRRGGRSELAGRRRSAAGDRADDPRKRCDDGLDVASQRALRDRSRRPAGAGRCRRAGRGERMRRAHALLAGLWEFVVGDDWRTALGVLSALALTALLADGAIASWWVMPPAVIGLLAMSVWRATQ